MVSNKIVQVKKDDVKATIDKYCSNGWDVLSISKINDKYEINFLLPSTTKKDRLTSTIFVLALLSVIGLFGMFMSGIMMAIIWCVFNTPEILVILFIIFLSIGLVGVVLSVIDLIALKKKWKHQMFYLLGIITLLTGNFLLGSLLIVYATQKKKTPN